MQVSFGDADRIFRAEKRLLGPLRWRPVESKRGNERHRRLESSVDVAGGVTRGVLFRTTVFPGSLGRMMFQLECDRSTGRTHDPLYRLDLDPRSPHINKLYGPDDLNGRRFAAGETHEHLFYDSLREDSSLGPNPCEQARPLADPPGDFPTALQWVCRRLTILNGHDVPNPGDQGLLL
jgi:hypothetical protein